MQTQYSCATIKKTNHVCLPTSTFKISDICIHRETDLIFIQFAVSIFLFSLVLKCDNNETDEDIDHEKGNNNNVNKIEAGNHWPIVVHWSHVFRVRID